MSVPINPKMVTDINPPSFLVEARVALAAILGPLKETLSQQAVGFILFGPNISLDESQLTLSIKQITETIAYAISPQDQLTCYNNSVNC